MKCIYMYEYELFLYKQIKFMVEKKKKKEQFNFIHSPDKKIK